MPQIINTNISSLTAQRNLNTSQSDQAQALERLSSGLRINSAKDDAAGLAISTRFTSQTRGLSVAIRNAGDGISLSQTAEGALGSISDNLQRVRELALQSANGTNSDSDREALNAEAQQLIAEITRTGDQTNFNGRNLLDGSFSSQFQIGANAGETIDVSINQLTADTIGAAETAGVSALGTGAALANGDLIINGVAIDPSQASSDTASFSDSSFSAIAKADAINAKSDATGVTAEVIDNVASGSEMTAASTNGTLTLNGVDIDLATGGVNASDDRNAVISAINARSDQTGVVASDGGDSGGVTLTAADGRNISVSFGGVGGDLTAASTGLTEGTSYGGYTLISKDGTDISVDGGNGTGTGDLSNSGLTAGVYSGREATLNTLERNLSSSTTDTAGTFSTSDMGITADTAINATNNTFEIAVSDGDTAVATSFELVTLGSSFDAGSGAGEYDDATQLAAQINDAITNGAANANLRDASGNALVVASAATDADGNLTGGITFTSANGGEGSEVVARTGAGNILLPTNSTEAAGTAAGTFKQDSINFIFDGTNALSAGTTLNISTTGTATDVDHTITASQTDPQALVDELNASIAGSAQAGLLEAAIADDGVTVTITALDAAITGITNNGDGDVTAAGETANFQHLTNGDVVITDVDTYADAIIGATEEISLNVGGAGANDINLGSGITAAYEAFTGVVGSYATDLAAAQDAASGTQSADFATFLNNALAIQPAGTGVTATDVGGQVVLSTSAGDGTLVAAAGTGTSVLGAAPADIGFNDEVDITTTATAGTAITGDFSVDADGNFISEDPDGAGTDFEAQLSPLVVTAGENDTFTINVDGSGDQSVTIAAGSYTNMSDLSAAINTAMGTPVTTPATTASVATTAGEVAIVIGADVAGQTPAAGDFDLSGNNLTFDISLDGGNTNHSITITSDNSADFTANGLDSAMTLLAGDLQTAIDAVSAGAIADQVEVAYNATTDRLEFKTTGVGAAATLDISSSVANAGANNDFTFTADATDAGDDLANLAAADFDFSTNNSTFDLSLNGSGVQTITINGDHSAGPAVSDSMTSLQAEIQAEVDAAFGAGNLTATFNAGTGGFDFVSTASGATADVTISNVAAGGTSRDLGFVQPSTGSGTASSTTAVASVAVDADNQGLTFSSSTTGTSSTVDITNGTFAVEGGFTSGATVTGAINVNALESGDLVINGTSIRGANGSDDTASDETALTSDAAASGISTAAAINASSDQTGVTATVNATELNGGDGTAALTADNGSTGTVYINNVAATPVTLTGDADADRAAAVNAINAISGQTGVAAEDNGKSITLTAADGRNISVAIDNNLEANAAAGNDSSNFGRSIGLSADDPGIGEADISGTGASYANVAGTTYSTVQLNSAGEISVSAGDNGADELAAIGLKEGSYGAGDNGIFISEIDISTFEGANDAIVAIDNALNQVSAERANLGAIQNRFQSTISNLEITSENLTAANSRIRDADFAAETAALSRAQVLQQAGISVLAQANALPQQALSLLQ